MMILFVQSEKSITFAQHLEKCPLQKGDAAIAQLVEHNLAKVGVASSSLVSRSKSSSKDFNKLSKFL